MGKKLRRLARWTARGIAVVVVLAVAAFLVAYWRSDNDCAERARTVPRNPMKAITYCDYGSADVLQLQNLEKPAPKPDEVLIRVHAAAVNPLDMHFMHGTPYVMRMGAGLRKPKVTRLGVDFSGTVEAVGANVKEFRPGDAVFGARTGAFAEYVTAPERLIVKKPDNLPFDQAAAVPVAALTALQALRDNAKVRPRQKVLINGASGGVGTFAVQIAKSLGAEVTGVCSTRNVPLVRSLGADHVIDYTRGDFTRGGRQYDVIIDMVGNHALSAYRRVLTPNGIYVMVGGQKGRWISPIDRVAAMSLYSRFAGDQRFAFFISKLNKSDLTTLRDLIAAGKVTPVIDRRYSLSQVPDAIRYLETGRARGKVVITVAEQHRP